MGTREIKNPCISGYFNWDNLVKGIVDVEQLEQTSPVTQIIRMQNWKKGNKDLYNHHTVVINIVLLNYDMFKKVQFWRTVYRNSKILNKNKMKNYCTFFFVG